jgi:pimeloyl-ACP methyl ester carboxylesterase
MPLVETRAGTLAYPDRGAALWRSFATKEHDLRERSTQLRVPTLIVWGRRDRAIPVSAGRATHEALPASHFAVLDTGHVPFTSAPVEFLALTEPFLRSVTEMRTA